MNQPAENPISPDRKVGRPRRGTEAARTAALINAATRVFLRDGYGQASMDKVAQEAGVSTRTIYERYKNKADLLAAVIGRLVDRLATVVATAALDKLPPRQALTWIGETITERARDPDSAALFRIVATEAHRFPELAARMRENNKLCIENEVASYLRTQIAKGSMHLSDPDRAARIFLQMVFSELHDQWLFGGDEALAKFDLSAHLNCVIELFLNGAAVNEKSP